MALNLLPVLTLPGKNSASLPTSSEDDLSSLTAIQTTVSFADLLRSPATIPAETEKTIKESILPDSAESAIPSPDTPLLTLANFAVPESDPTLITPSSEELSASPISPRDIAAQQLHVITTQVSTSPIKKVSLTAESQSPAMHQRTQDETSLSISTLAKAPNTVQSSLITAPLTAEQSSFSERAASQPAPTPSHIFTPAQTASILERPTLSSQELRAPLGSSQWIRDLSQQFIFHKPGVQTLHLTLHPKELGDVKMSLTVHNAHAELMMLSNHGQVRAALEAAIPQLRQALADNGIQLTHSQVGQETTYQSPSHSDAHQSPTSPQEREETVSKDVDNAIKKAECLAPLRREGSHISLLV
ncbi:flagellar hook-length control protein FliK [Rosenbergiella australiborealis]|uniref:flagellar hook-length control protein FliK n=1 Tax=Rosenbergiella australiborealis TaxID=1544696 RepID=UPI001F4EA192|nr:flagellar hook-length control protein FliK [Rosenbergiella australiborealis]